ncbi:MAG: glycosyltransferase [Desulforhopalus sp.]
MSLRIAMLSIHSSPVGLMGTGKTGGMSIYVRELARELGRRNHSVDIFTCQIEKNIKPLVHLYPNVRLVYIANGQRSAMVSAEELYDEKELIARSMSCFADEWGINYSLIHSHYWLSGLIGEELKKGWNCPHIITFHTLGAAKMASFSGQKEHGERLIEENRLLQQCDGIIAPTTAERSRYEDIQSCAGERIHIVPCGVDMKQFRVFGKNEGGIQGNTRNRQDRILLFVGRFDSMKGIDTLLHSVALLPKEPFVHLMLIGGDGTGSPAQQRIADKATELGIDTRLRFLGSVEHQLMAHYYNSADALVVASCYESFGLVIVEALACGTPVAAMPVGIGPEVIRPDINGCLAKEANERSLALAISDALLLAEKSDPVEIRRTVAQFTWSRVAENLLDVYHKVIKRKSSTV